MFAYLHGRLDSKAAGAAVIDVGGVGYQVQIPLSTFYELGEEGESVRLRITAQIRDDTMVLFGFLTSAEQQMFRHLISVSGVGPRIAIAVLSGMPVLDVAQALTTGDSARLQSIPGIGRRTAERLTVELKDRVRGLGPEEAPKAPDAAPGLREDVVSALVNLGYPATQAEKATDTVLGAVEGEPPPFSLALRETLRRLHR